VIGADGWRAKVGERGVGVEPCLILILDHECGSVLINDTVNNYANVFATTIWVSLWLRQWAYLPCLKHTDMEEDFWI